MSTTDLVAIPSKTTAEESTKELWPEPLDTPGVIPRHLTRSAAASSPLLEILQRLLYRLRPSDTGDLEKALALLGLYQAIRPIYGHIKDLVLWTCTVEITIPESDPVAKEILAWMGAEVVKKRHTHSAMLVTGGMETNSHSHAHIRRFPGPPQLGEEESQDVVYVPALGTRLFWIGFRPFMFYRSGGQGYHRNAIVSGNLVDERGRLQNALTMTTLGWSLDPLHKFVEYCHEFKRKNLNGTTTVYYAGGDRHDPYSDMNGWQSVFKAVRKLDTIDMDEGIKSDIIRDAEYYYSAQSRQFFADCGIPYRRGYLFHGPPGTGKSSFSAALAGHLQCDIYHINLSSGSMNDGTIHRLFLTLPRRCIVVIEDIDSAGIGREQAPSEKPEASSTPPKLAALLSGAGLPPMPSAAGGKTDRFGHDTRPRNTVTLSGLLNAIDGNASQEGRLLIMTSNNPDALDKALVRPGRVDRKVYFGNMTKSAGKSIFKRLIGRSAIAHDAAFTMEQIEQYADEFSDKVPANTFTPADVQNYLQGCRGDPVKALNDIDAWIVEHRGKTADTGESRSSETASFVLRPEETDGSEADLV